MTNRLRKLLRTIFYCVGFLFSIACIQPLNAQAGFFNFNYNGPDSLAVGVNCNLALQGNIPNPVVTSTIGAVIITSAFDATASGFPYNQLWIANEVAHVYWFVEDNMGHAHTFEFFVSFVDNTPPAFNLTGINDTLFYNSILQVPPAPVIPIVDNCTGFSQMLVETTAPSICAAGQFTRTWTATDAVGNTAVFTQTIIIEADVTPPTISFPPQNGGAACELLATAYPAWLAAQMAAFTASDPSGIKSLTNNAPASFPPGCKVPLSVTFKATDNCNLMIQTTAVFTTSDTEAPVVIVAPKDTVAYCSPGGNHLAKLNQWISSHAYAQVYDSCSAPLTYTMKKGLVVVDSAAVVAMFNASFNNACGTQLIGSQLIDQVSASVEIVFVVSDACGKETVAGQATFAALDTLSPVISGVDTTEQCGGGDDQLKLENWINAKANATISDDCSTAYWTNFSFTTSNGQSGSGTFNAGPYPNIVANSCTWFTDVTFNASDECGNASAKTLRFQIVDTIAPVFSGFSPSIIVYCPNPLPTVPAAIITDNCDLTPTITFSRVYKDTICAGSYTVETTWKATDDCGNKDSIIQIIFVQDTTRPVFTLVPVGIFMRCDTFELPPTPVQGMDINATDICSPVVSITTATVSAQNPNPALCSHYSYNITRTFTAMDECGNTKTATQLISVIDNQPPVPGGVLDTTALCSALTPFPAPAPIAIDACSGPTVAPFFVDMETIPDSCTGQYTLKLNWIAIDVCGNQASFPQLVHVVDTVAPLLSNIPPHITVECEGIPIPPNTSSFNAIDNCALNASVVLNESEIRNPDITSCDHWTNYTVRREWTTTDDCGRARTYTQDIQVEDTTPPVIVPPPAILLPNDMDDCGADIPIPAPLSLVDNCTSGSASVMLKDTMPITAPPGPINTTPVDSVFFHFSTPNLPPNQPATTNVALSIFMDRVDADLESEYFRVYGENGVLLGKTGRTTSSCSATPSDTVLTITAAQFNDWASDGDLAITLAPNGTSNLAINPTCGNSQARMYLDYSYAAPHLPIQLSYTLDGGSSQPYPPPGSTFLAIGTHTVVYTATDCVGNSSSASVQITVNDTQPPSITSPAPITAYVTPGICSTSVKLPFPVITENCTMSGQMNKSSAFLPISFIMDPDLGNIPAIVSMGIPGLIPNAISNGTLRIKFKGDNAEPREFFNIFHNATPISRTDSGDIARQCLDTVITPIAVSPADINAWAATGTAIFRAEPNTDAGPLFDFDFINPCGPLLPDLTDGTSRIQAMLEYNYAIINFTIFQGNTVVASGALQGSQTMVMLPPGSYTVKYTTTDNAGLMGMTTFPLVVRDTIKPLAQCKPSYIIHVNPSGVNDYTLQPSEINNGSMDNCSGANLTFGLSQTNFTCNQAGNNYIVTMTVTDTSGNTAICSTVVLVQNEMPMPTADSVCEGDTLQLHANPPVPGTFTYMWTHTNFNSTLEEPFRLNAQPNFQGQYTVKITGVTGCTATGSVNVNFVNLTVPLISVSGGNGANFCQGQNVTLSTLPFQGGVGQAVSYQWYSAFPTTLLATTNFPTYTVNPPPGPGVYQYFVKVKVGECLTPNSIVIMVTVFARPPAVVEDAFVNVCAGELLTLGTTVSGAGLTYLWTGPGGTSTAPYPVISNAAMPSDAGIYILKTFQNGCESIPSDSVLVNVKYTPPMPQIIADTTVCVGDTITLFASVAGAPPPDFYEWEAPTSNNLPTNNAATLILPDVSTLQCGNWRVRARYQGCYSAWSAPFNICPQEFPIVTASSNSPICQDSTLELTSTSSFGGLSWCWTFPDSQQFFQQNLSITPGFPGVYQVVGKTSHGCSDTAEVTVLGSQAPVVDSIVVTAPMCADGTSDAMLTPFYSSNNAPFSFFWYQNGLVISNDTILMFPNVLPSATGVYTFVVKDMFGCPSAPKTVTLNVQAQVQEPDLMLSHNPVCAGSTTTLTLTGNYNSNPLYHWITPSGDTIITTGKQLPLNNVTVADSGNYVVFVSEGTCRSPLSNTVTLTVNPIPPTPMPFSNQPICVGGTLQLNTDPDIQGATYRWTGPGFPSIVDKDPVWQNVSLLSEGTYTVVIEINGCQSAPATTQVDILSPPKDPILTPANPAPVCLGQLPITGFVSIKLESQTFGSTYTWINPATGDTIRPPSGLPFLNFADLPDSLLTPGFHSFQVVAWKSDNLNGDGCNSAFSNIVTVRFDTIPSNIAQTAPDHNACASPFIALTAAQPSGNITGQWSQVGGPLVSIVNPDTASTTFLDTLGNNIYTFSWSLSSGACKNFSIDLLEINVVRPEQANAGRDTFICDATDFALKATQGQFSSGTWSQMGQTGVVIADPEEPNSPVTGFNPGNRYVFFWTLDDIGCGAAQDVVFIDYSSGKPNISGPPFVCAEEHCAILDAQGLQIWETGQWTSQTGALNFAPPNAPSTSVCGLVPGANEVYWTINEGRCGNNSRDTFVVNYGIFPGANPDVVSLAFGDTAHFQVLSNDVIPNTPDSVRIVINPAFGVVTPLTANGAFVYKPNAGFSGTDVLTYKLCNFKCGPDACSTTTVTFTVGTAGDCFPPTVITPNDDALNDAFKLPPECYLFGEGQGAEIEVTIFNQWGDYVYHKKPFLQDVDEWDGTKSGQELPVGTYYFVVKIEGEAKARRGFLILQR